MKNIPIALPLLALAGCYYFESNEEKKCSPIACHDSLPQIVSGIPLPDGYTRLVKPPGSFAEWLGNVRLKKRQAGISV